MDNDVKMLIATCAFCNERYEKQRLGDDGHRCKEMKAQEEEVLLSG